MKTLRVTSFCTPLFRAALATIATGIATQAFSQTVQQVGPAVPARSSRVVIRGSGFGETPGAVFIGGVAAHVARWTPDRIAAYLAEETPLGVADIIVSAPVVVHAGPVTVIPRPAREGRLRWRFDGDAPYFRTRPAVGPDGSIYAVDAQGTLYALETDGALRWLRAAAASQSPSIATDGTVYVSGLGGMVTALDPVDGSTLWTLPHPSNAGPLYSGPTVGPDGNIYIATDEYLPGGLDFGAAAISPSGTILWNRSNDFGVRVGSLGYAWELTPGTDAVYLASGQGNPIDNVRGVFALSRDGDILWSANSIMWPRLGADGNVYLRNLDGNYYASYTPSGTQRWRVSHSTIGGTPSGDIAVDLNNNFYATSGLNLGSGDSEGQTRWITVLNSTTTQHVGVRPDGNLVVTHTSPYSHSFPCAILGFRADNGEELWSQELGFDGEQRIAQVWNGTFSESGETWYVPGSGDNGAPDPIAPLFAIDTSDFGGISSAESVGSFDRDFKLTAQPNPILGSTTLSFVLAVPSPIDLEVFDPAGRRTLVLGADRAFGAGHHRILWDGRDNQGDRVAGGNYWVRLRAGGREQSVRVVILDR